MGFHHLTNWAKQHPEQSLEPQQEDLELVERPGSRAARNAAAPELRGTTGGLRGLRKDVNNANARTSARTYVCVCNVMHEFIKFTYLLFRSYFLNYNQIDYNML